MFKFSFAEIEYTFELPETYEEETFFYMQSEYSLGVFINRESTRFSLYSIAGSNSHTFAEQLGKWFEIYKQNCPRSVSMQITRRCPETYAVCIKDTWLTLKYMPDQKIFGHPI